MHDEDDEEDAGPLHDLPATAKVEPETDSEDETEEEVEPAFSSAAEWVRKWLAQVLSSRKFSPQPGKGLRWDPEWWQYPEVRSRFESLWRSWEEARAEGSGSAMSRWWVHEFDAHMQVILNGDTGPFHLYDPDKPRMELYSLPVVDPPPGMDDGSLAGE